MGGGVLVRVRIALAWLQRPRSIRRQLIIGVTGVHMILMMSFVFDLIDRQKAFLAERARSRTLHQAGILAAASVPQLITSDSAGLHEILGSMLRDRTIRSAAVTDTTGRIRADANFRKFGVFLDDERSRKVLNGEALPQVYFENGTTVWSAAPILSESRLLGWAWVAGDLRPDAAQLQAVHRTGLIYIVVAIAAGAVFAIVLANGITRQLRLLLAGTRRMAEDRLEQPVAVITDNDVGVVARAFNEAMRRLATERTQLVQTRNRLEAEVRVRRRAEAELTAANRAMVSANESLRQFAYAASHDLQEPLRGVSAYSELLKRRYRGKLDQDADEFIDYIYEGAERMHRLIKALLDYSRAGAGTEAEPVEVDTHAALEAALKNLGTAVEESGAKIEAGRLPRVMAHQVAVAQLFQNLIGNAIKYAKPGVPPEIAIRAGQQEDRWLFLVADNGLGIAPEQHERIFRIFRRAHKAHCEGEGIGLAICSKIVERYGGRIWVESEPGVGATFHFTLPAVGDTRAGGGGPLGLSITAGCDAA